MRFYGEENAFTSSGVGGRPSNQVTRPDQRGFFAVVRWFHSTLLLQRARILK